MSENNRFPQGPIVDSDSRITFEWFMFFQNPTFTSVTLITPLDTASGGTGQSDSITDEISMSGPFYPAPGDGTTQAAVAFFAGTGIPDNAIGMNGNFFFRGDGIAANTNIYKKSAGLWVGIA